MVGGWGSQGELQNKKLLCEEWNSRKINTTPRTSGAKRNLLWAEGIEKGVPWDLMDGMPTVALEKLIWAWKDKKKVPPKTEQPTREYKDGTPFWQHDGNCLQGTYCPWKGFDRSSDVKLDVPSPISEPEDSQWVCLRRLTENNKGDLLITFPLGPFKTPVTFLVDTGAQMLALWADKTNLGHICFWKL